MRRGFAFYPFGVKTIVLVCVPSSLPGLAMRHLLAMVLLLVPAVASAAGPTCALLDPEKTPRAALLEAKLLAEPGANWVERADIDKVLKEQKLQAAFGPQGVGERVKLGKLLKADLLVMVRPVKDAKEQTLEVVVSETATGLRLLLRAVPVTKNTDADIAELLAAAKDGIKRHGEKVAEVVAVPPFVSNDLELTHDHLRGALAKLAEAEALDRKGVLVVELEEAEALAKEIALAAPGTTLARPLPVYLLGEFRHEGKGKDATVSVKLRAEHGGKPIGKPEVAVVKPDESPAAVRKWSAGVLDALAKDDRPRPPGDPKVEAKQLTERAFVLRRLGNWPECLTLFEASLLLDPTQTDLHAEAVKALTPLLPAAFHRGCYLKTDGKNEEAERFARLYRRGLAHLDAFADKGGDFMKYSDVSGANMVMWFRNAGHCLNHPGSNVHRDMEQILRELKKEDDAVMARINPIFARQHFLASGRPRPAPAERFVKPDGYDPDAKPDPAANRIKMTPIALTVPAPKPPAWPVKRFLGILAAGPKTDVVWSHKTLYLMTEKGKLREVWDTRDMNTQFQSVQFDGKYLWCVATRFLNAPLLEVLDPATGKTHEVTNDDGLPWPTAEQRADRMINHRLTVAPLGPGRACVAGGTPRTWVAVVTCDPADQKAEVKVIHEAREASDREGTDQWLSTTVAFRPSFMLTLRDKPDVEGKVVTRVLLGRGDTDNLEVNTFPLVIDPDAPAVTVAPFRLQSGSYSQEESWAGNTFATSGGAAYRAYRIIYPRLLRVPFPGTASEVLAEALPQCMSFPRCRDGPAPA